MQTFPSNNDEFEALLRSMGVDIRNWIGAEYSRSNVLKFLFLRGLWEIAHGATPRSFHPAVVDREKTKARANVKYMIDPTVKTLDRMLNAGLSPEEVADFVTKHRMEAVLQILYFLDDPACIYSFEISENMTFHLYTEDASEHPIGNSRSDWSALFQWLGYVENQ